MTTTQDPAPPVATAEAVTPEVVVPADTDTPTAPLPATIDPGVAAANALIDRAADAALMPGVPGRDEFITLAMTARILCLSGAAPKEVQNNPYLAFHMAMVGRDLGISPSASLELIDVIPGSRNGDRPPRLSLSPQLLNGQVERLGLGHIIPGRREIDRAIAIAVAPGGEVDYRCRASWPDHWRDGDERCSCHGIIGDSEFTWEDARMAGLVAPKCQPGVHDPACLAYGGNGPHCNQGYKTYPKRMMWWRAAGFCADDWFPTASMGLYSPEALGAVVDDEGRPIDPSTVALPSGYEPEAPKPPEPVAMIATADRDDLRRRLRSLPEEAQPLATAAWRQGLDGSYTDPAQPYLQPLGKEGEHPKLPERQLGKARALVAHFEDRAKRGEWGDWTPPAAPPADPEPAGDGSGEGAAADAPKDPAEPATPADPPVGDGAGDPPPPPVTEPLPRPSEEPTARVGVPQPPDATAAAEATNVGNPADCPVCAGTGMLDGESCWGCEGGASLPPCIFCASDSTLRHDLGADVVRCIDQDACWRREQEAQGTPASTSEAVTDVESREVTPAGELPPDPDEPTECPLCHSAKSKLVFVPAGRGEEGGVWRCQNASACKERAKGKSGLDVARAALDAAAPPAAG